MSTKGHDRALALLQGEISLDGAPPHDKPHFFVRRRLETAVALLEDVLRAEPENGSALFAAGKAHERLGHLPEAFDLLVRAHRGAPANTEYAREAGLLGAQLGLTLDD